ncbi:MAG: hypothetical protein J7M26_04030, partial [Armatimonadetes bacterium]|nr:hypothetical protein [Armatimonadota bacterium]
VAVTRTMMRVMGTGGDDTKGEDRGRGHVPLWLWPFLRGDAPVEISKLLQYSKDIPPLVEGTPPWRVEPALDHLFAAEEWELLGVLLLTVAEGTAREIISRLLERRIYEPLVVAACLRRHIRTQPYVLRSGGGIASRVFRDIDAAGEEDAKSIPPHIMEEIQDMAQTSERTREAQLLRSESIDRGPMREFIVNRLAERLNMEDEAVEALVTIARAAAWEETRRIAAMKVANNDRAMRILAQALSTQDLIAVAEASELGAIASKVAGILGEHLEELQQRGDVEALNFVAEHHEDSSVKEAARQAAEAAQSAKTQDE